jgi:hypothetical protein
MKKWQYTVKHGNELRNAISNDNGIQVIKTLVECYNEILQNYSFEDDYDKEQFEEANNLLDGDDLIIIDCKNGKDNIQNYGFDNINELVDARLEEFYDLCDDYNIWVGGV